ncbi:V-ATPase V0 sector subunit c'' [Pleodorina starrii]|nr:V-ATPase V0 sector subunit c'' [Pleodorina starrii]
MALAIRGLRTCAAGRGIRQALSQRVVPAPVQPFRVRPVATASTAEVTAYTNVEKGDKDTLEYRMFFKQGGKEVSCWHEIPLHAGNGLLHYICEIPKETSAKMEVATDEPCTPIKQDVKKGKLRFYPYNINWNYGMLPQTWEDPGTTNPDLQAAGDNDPVDVVEIGSATAKRGGVYKVKPVGVLAMIDDGELDWKVIAVAADDPKADLVNDVEDVEKHFPGEIQKVLEWFRDYKIPDGKPANKFGYDNKCMNKEFTMHVIQETHEAYVKLKSGARANTEELSLI